MENNKRTGSKGCLAYLLIIIIVALIFSSCCREATEWNVKRWEKKTDFRSNGPVYKKSYVKYPKQKKQLIIRY